MRRLWGWVWLRWLVALVLVAVGITTYVLLRAERRDAQLAENREQLEKFCGGMLPAAELRHLLPSDSAGRAEEFGVFADPRRPSRALIDCTLAWGGGGDAWEPDARVRIQAVAALPGEEADLSPGKLVEPVATWAAPRGGSGELTYDATLHGGEVTAWLRLECPGGLDGRVRLSHDLRVRVDYPVRAGFASDLTSRDHLVPARTAVGVANMITASQHCGSPRWQSPDEVMTK
ncbi:hypothetical protein [Streptomyces sp. NPDC057702]|uniref:hypothetical protein n=1 Tax=unclassified Streptomyces TaxID=2593676 RepID=UPI003676934A